MMLRLGFSALRSHWLSVGVFFLIVLAVVFNGASAADLEEWTLFRQKAFSPLEEELDRVQDAHPDDQGLVDFRRRITLVGEVSAELIRQFRAIESASFKNLLDDVIDVPESRSPGNMTLSAVEIVQEYGGPFSRDLGIPSVPTEELTKLLEYYDATARSAGAYIAEQGRLVATISESTASQVSELCVVLPFLHISDEKWSFDEIESLPEWMKRPEHIRGLERFSLRVQRPLTAYQFGLYHQGSSDEESIDFTQYTLQSAEWLLAKREYHACIYCLRLGIDVADEKGRRDEAITLRFRLGDVLVSVGHHQLAAEHMMHVLDSYPEADALGKAALLRLKYVYQAGDLAQVVKDASAYQRNPQFKHYLPQIMYMSWVAHHRLNLTEDADRIKVSFLEQFPMHSLAADMHFASAMAALLASDYDEALRITELIEYRYPESRIAGKVNDIRERLEQMEKDERDR